MPKKTLKIPLTINSTNLEEVASYKYLGVQFNNTGKFQTSAKELVKRGKQKIDAMWPTLMKAKLPKFNNLMQYLDSVILPRVTYAAQIWAIENTDILEMTQTYFMRKLLLIYPPRAANYFLRLELGRLHIQHRIVLATIKFHCKVFNMSDTRLPKIVLRE